MRDLKEEMAIASDALAFEEAAKLRDSLHALQRYNQKMKIVDNSLADRDLFAIDVDPDLGEACGVLFKIWEGKMIGKFYSFLINIEGVSRAVMIISFFLDSYNDTRVVGRHTYPD